MKKQMIDFKELSRRAYNTAKKNGFHHEEYTLSHYTMLVLTELCEAVNANRKGKFAQYFAFNLNINTPQENPEEHWKFCFETFIKDTVEDELADAFIRILDIYGKYEDELGVIDNEEANRFLFADEKLDDIDEFTSQVMAVVLAITKEENPPLAMKFLILIARHYDIDLFWFIEQKMKYNEMRPYKHGCAY